MVWLIFVCFFLTRSPYLDAWTDAKAPKRTGAAAAKKKVRKD